VAPRIIDRFRGEYSFLSNFAWVGSTTVEHKFQAEKTLDEVERAKILRAATPRDAKRIGRWEIKARPDWEQIKHERMKHWLEWKFSQPPFDLLLEATGEAVLIEGNQHGDDIWGCVWRNGTWAGQNWLGRLLMEVRSERRAAIKLAGAPSQT
jgi:ribA/ribD-fused uncharacterized protein